MKNQKVVMTVYEDENRCIIELTAKSYKDIITWWKKELRSPKQKQTP